MAGFGHYIGSGIIVSPSAGGGGVVDDMIFIEDEVVGVGGAASVTFGSIVGTYRHLQVHFTARGSDSALQNLVVQVNGDTTANYNYEYLYSSGASALGSNGNAVTGIQAGFVPGTSGPASSFCTGVINFPYYADTVHRKGLVGSTIGQSADDGTGTFNVQASGLWRTANAAITQIVFSLTTGNFVQNSSFSVYGIT